MPRLHELLLVDNERNPNKELVGAWTLTREGVSRDIENDRRLFEGNSESWNELSTIVRSREDEQQMQISLKINNKVFLDASFLWTTHQVIAQDVAGMCYEQAWRKPG